MQFSIAWETLSITIGAVWLLFFDKNILGHISIMMKIFLLLFVACSGAEFVLFVLGCNVVVLK